MTKQRGPPPLCGRGLNLSPQHLPLLVGGCLWAAEQLLLPLLAAAPMAFAATPRWLTQSHSPDMHPNHLTTSCIGARVPWSSSVTRFRGGAGSRQQTQGHDAVEFGGQQGLSQSPPTEGREVSP